MRNNSYLGVEISNTSSMDMKRGRLSSIAVWYLILCPAPQIIISDRTGACCFSPRWSPTDAIVGGGTNTDSSYTANIWILLAVAKVCVSESVRGVGHQTELLSPYHQYSSTRFLRSSALAARVSKLRQFATFSPVVYYLIVKWSKTSKLTIAVSWG